MNPYAAPFIPSKIPTSSLNPNAFSSRLIEQKALLEPPVKVVADAYRACLLDQEQKYIREIYKQKHTIKSQQPEDITLEFSIEDLMVFLKKNHQDKVIESYLTGSAAAYALSCFNSPYAIVPNDVDVSVYVGQFFKAFSLDIHLFLFEQRTYAYQVILQRFNEAQQKVVSPQYRKDVEQQLTDVKQRLVEIKNLTLSSEDILSLRALYNPFCVNEEVPATKKLNEIKNTVGFSHYLKTDLRSAPYFYLISFGNLDVKFCMEQEGCSSNVAPADGFQINFQHLYGVCVNNGKLCNGREYERALIDLQQRIYRINHWLSIRNLLLRVIFKMTQGFLFSEYVNSADYSNCLLGRKNIFQGVMERVFATTKSLEEAKGLTRDFGKHQSNHYPNSSLGKTIDFLNAVAIGVFAFQQDEKRLRKSMRSYSSALMEAYADKMIILNNVCQILKQRPDQVVNVLKLIRGIYFLQWLKGNTAIECYNFGFATEYPLRFQCGIAQKNERFFLALEEYHDPFTLFCDFFTSWIELETHAKAFGDALINLPNDLNFAKLVLNSENKNQVLASCLTEDRIKRLKGTAKRFFEEKEKMQISSRNKDNSLKQLCENMLAAFPEMATSNQLRLHQLIMEEESVKSQPNTETIGLIERLLKAKSTESVDNFNAFVLNLDRLSKSESSVKQDSFRFTLGKLLVEKIMAFRKDEAELALRVSAFDAIEKAIRTKRLGPNDAQRLYMHLFESSIAKAENSEEANLLIFQLITQLEHAKTHLSQELLKKMETHKSKSAAFLWGVAHGLLKEQKYENFCSLVKMIYSYMIKNAENPDEVIDGLHQREEDNTILFKTVLNILFICRPLLGFELVNSSVVKADPVKIKAVLAIVKQFNTIHHATTIAYPLWKIVAALPISNGDIDRHRVQLGASAHLLGLLCLDHISKHKEIIEVVRAIHAQMSGLTLHRPSEALIRQLSNSLLFVIRSLHSIDASWVLEEIRQLENLVHKASFLQKEHALFTYLAIIAKKQMTPSAVNLLRESNKDDDLGQQVVGYAAYVIEQCFVKKDAALFNTALESIGTLLGNCFLEKQENKQKFKAELKKIISSDSIMPSQEIASIFLNCLALGAFYQSSYPIEVARYIHVLVSALQEFYPNWKDNPFSTLLSKTPDRVCHIVNTLRGLFFIVAKQKQITQLPLMPHPQEDIVVVIEQFIKGWIELEMMYKGQPGLSAALSQLAGCFGPEFQDIRFNSDSRIQYLEKLISLIDHLSVEIEREKTYAAFNVIIQADLDQHPEIRYRINTKLALIQLQKLAEQDVDKLREQHLHILIKQMMSLSKSTPQTFFYAISEWIHSLSNSQELQQIVQLPNILTTLQNIFPHLFQKAFVERREITVLHQAYEAIKEMHNRGFFSPTQKPGVIISLLQQVLKKSATQEGALLALEILQDPIIHDSSNAEIENICNQLQEQLTFQKLFSIAENIVMSKKILSSRDVKDVCNCIKNRSVDGLQIESHAKHYVSVVCNTALKSEISKLESFALLEEFLFTTNLPIQSSFLEGMIDMAEKMLSKEEEQQVGELLLRYLCHCCRNDKALEQKLCGVIFCHILCMIRSASDQWDAINYNASSLLKFKGLNDDARKVLSELAGVTAVSLNQQNILVEGLLDSVGSSYPKVLIKVGFNQKLLPLYSHERVAKLLTKLIDDCWIDNEHFEAAIRAINCILIDMKKCQIWPPKKTDTLIPQVLNLLVHARVFNSSYEIKITIWKYYMQLVNMCPKLNREETIKLMIDLKYYEGICGCFAADANFEESSFWKMAVHELQRWYSANFPQGTKDYTTIRRCLETGQYLNYLCCIFFNELRNLFANKFPDTVLMLCQLIEISLRKPPIHLEKLSKIMPRSHEVFLTLTRLICLIKKFDLESAKKYLKMLTEEKHIKLIADFIVKSNDEEITRWAVQMVPLQTSATTLYGDLIFKACSYISANNSGKLSEVKSELLYQHARLYSIELPYLKEAHAVFEKITDATQWQQICKQEFQESQDYEQQLTTTAIPVFGLALGNIAKAALYDIDTALKILEKWIIISSINISKGRLSNPDDCLELMDYMDKWDLYGIKGKQSWSKNPALKKYIAFYQRLIARLPADCAMNINLLGILQLQVQEGADWSDRECCREIYSSLKLILDKVFDWCILNKHVHSLEKLLTQWVKKLGKIENQEAIEEGLMLLKDYLKLIQADKRKKYNCAEHFFNVHKIVLNSEVFIRYFGAKAYGKDHEIKLDYKEKIRNILKYLKSMNEDSCQNVFRSMLNEISNKLSVSSWDIGNKIKNSFIKKGNNTSLNRLLGKMLDVALFSHSHVSKSADKSIKINLPTRTVQPNMALCFPLPGQALDPSVPEIRIIRNGTPFIGLRWFYSFKLIDDYLRENAYQERSQGKVDDSLLAIKEAQFKAISQTKKELEQLRKEKRLESMQKPLDLLHEALKKTYVTFLKNSGQIDDCNEMLWKYEGKLLHMLIKHYQLQIGGWKPTDPASVLIKQINQYGPQLVLLENLSFPHQMIKQQYQLLGRDVWAWKVGKDNLLPSIEVMGSCISNLIVIVGAGAMRGDLCVWYMDPCDGSDPENAANQKIYELPYTQFVSLAKLITIAEKEYHTLHAKKGGS